MSKIKSELCNNLIVGNYVNPYYVIQHSFTDNGEREIGKTIVATDDIFPCLTTRPDVLGVVVYDKKKK